MNDALNPDRPGIIWTAAKQVPKIEDLQLPDRIEHIVLHRASSNEFRFLHESSIVRHGRSFFVAWNNSPAGERERGTAIRWLRTDDDFATWSAPRIFAPPLENETNVWESVQLLSADGELWAFTGQVHRLVPLKPCENAGRMVILKFIKATQTWKEQGSVDGFHPLSRPQHLPDGGWIMGGQYNLALPKVAISRGTDLTRWDVVEIPSKPDDHVNYAETSLLLDGNNITAHIRTGLEHLFMSESRDGGRTWSQLNPSNLPMTSSKTCAGRLSTGQRFLAFNMRRERDVLVIAVSAAGEKHLSKIVLIRNGKSPTPRTPGLCKTPQWSYPSVEEHAGKMYITYSVTKEDCCLSILPMEELSF